MTDKHQKPPGIQFEDCVITHFDENSLWLQWPSGEGMQISKDRMKYWMDKIYSEDF